MNIQVTSLENKLNLLELQGEAALQTSKVTKDFLNQVARPTTEREEQEKQLAALIIAIEKKYKRCPE